MKKLSLLLSVLLALILSTSVWPQGGGSSVGVGNPAYKNCTDLEGEMISTSIDDVYDTCKICEWTLYRTMDEMGIANYPVIESGIIGYPNPAAYNCKKIDGYTVLNNDEFGQKGFCYINAWTLFHVININE